MVVIGGHSVIVNRLQVSKNLYFLKKKFYNILYLMYNKLHERKTNGEKFILWRLF
jgi:hypothetical protein